MEKEKRKRNEEEREKGVEKKVSKKEEASEDEVEEFFAILKRMKVAMNYFEKAGGKDWRSAVEAEVVVTEEEEEKELGVEKKGEAVEVEESGGGLLDLNAVPEEKS
ncbi:hypothetical protein SLEP1_g33253 [Rubroshorea leprosula]|uniref:Uncharacterized protein n=1 Tax=Rubroshorea leprosula TaxID=152421 RepID=A0AAV5KG16_9ROSI|nr:hypothetical protein SLEP1_g33253 [Rubroshorea leprosula]